MTRLISSVARASSTAISPPPIYATTRQVFDNLTNCCETTRISLELGQPYPVLMPLSTPPHLNTHTHPLTLLGCAPIPSFKELAMALAALLSRRQKTPSSPQEGSPSEDLERDGHVMAESTTPSDYNTLSPTTPEAPQQQLFDAPHHSGPKFSSPFPGGAPLGMMSCPELDRAKLSASVFLLPR